METETNKMTKQPSYRFVGYTEPWEQKKLGEIAELYQPTTISSSELKETGYPVFGANGYIGYYDEYNHKESQVTISARGEGTGTPNFVVGPVWITGNSMVVNIDRNTEKIDKYFLFSNFLSFKFKKYVTGGAQPQLTREVLSTITFNLPSLSEQTAIGSFFQDIDQLISLQQRKLEVLKEQKKTYLKLLFPAKGQTKPALRFAGFEDEWTTTLLGDISELYQPKTISSEELLTEGFPVFGANGYIGYYKDYNHKEDQVTISARGEGTGTPSFVEGPVWITGNSMVVNVEKQANIIKPFLYAFCLSFNFKPFVTGGAQPQLTREVLKKVNIMLPSLPEQEAIGSFFQDIDQAIAKQEEKVNQLKESKQTLLRKMFI